ncbi:hypothetical protein CHH28_16650 [Bacterioplanes sanyensis]|uniref:Uncharacterized protein n=1 Tax=Bacterioplanes sanyensis TaxID=1249553 RepID=A0A222FNW5_9GAMM|nr:hypothetical protein CHH28_16650 [Bacterioplanes sanyensis]
MSLWQSLHRGSRFTVAMVYLWTKAQGPARPLLVQSGVARDGVSLCSGIQAFMRDKVNGEKYSRR